MPVPSNSPQQRYFSCLGQHTCVYGELKHGRNLDVQRQMSLRWVGNVIVTLGFNSFYSVFSNNENIAYNNVVRNMI